jgi:hypothetical protein
MGLFPLPGNVEADLETAARVADALADAVARGSRHALTVARSYSEEEVTLGLAFLARVIEIAAMSQRALADVQRERTRGRAGGASLAMTSPRAPVN